MIVIVGTAAVIGLSVHLNQPKMTEEITIYFIVYNNIDIQNRLQNIIRHSGPKQNKINAWVSHEY